MVKIEFNYEIKNQLDELICTGSSVLAFIDTKNMKPTRCPDYLLKGLGF
jgi:acyl-CoA thioester hydrolase